MGFRGMSAFQGRPPSLLVIPVQQGDDGDLADDLAEKPGPVHVPGRDLGTDTMTPVFVLDAKTTASSRWHDRMTPAVDGNLRLFVCADDEFIRRERTATLV